jgi:DNA-binding transcriptional regulator GbsR (MarR family)
MTDHAVKLTPAAEKLVLHWGEMGSRWGLNRTVAQVHALLYVAPRPLHAGEIADTLAVARSNVSTGLRELEAWGIVKVTHLLGDRRDYFETVTDIWQLFRLILEARWRREIEPTRAVLDTCVAEAERAGADGHTTERLRELQAFFRTLESWYEQLRTMELSQVKRVARMGAKVRGLLKLGGSLGSP